MKRLGEDDQSRLNGTINHCERLLNARGKTEGPLVICHLTEADIAIALLRYGPEEQLQVTHHGQRVLLVLWNEPHPKGYCEEEAGDWASVLLGIPVYHA